VLKQFFKQAEPSVGWQGGGICKHSNRDLWLQVYTQLSLPTPMASKLLPLRVRRSCSIGTASRLISFSDGGGEPSTQPFHPFLTATLFFL